MQERKINAGSFEVNCAEGPPSGPSLVMLHSLPGRLQEFSVVIPNLSHQGHIFAMNVNG